MDNTYIRKSLNWQPRSTFETGLERTVRWYVDNQQWWKRVQSEAYKMTRSMYLQGEKA